MPWFDREADEEAHNFQRRIAEALEDIARTLRRDLKPPAHVRSINFMALPTGPVTPGFSDTFTATAVDAAGNVLPEAVPVVTSSDETVLTLVSDGIGGTSTITFTVAADAAADASATITGSFNGVDLPGTDDPATITVGAAVPAVAAINFA